MRMPIIAGNWKMHTTLGEAVELVKVMLPRLSAIEGVEKVLCPPYISLSAVKELVRSTQIKLGAQNVHFEERGAYTGGISPPMLVGLCEYVILGHSERRQHWGETDQIVNAKIKAVLKVGLKPILCVGERLEHKNAGKTSEVVTGQVKAALSGVDSPEGLVIAYEPVWAIGTGRAATGEDANETIGIIRRTVADLYGQSFASEMRIQYGGSVTAGNAAEFMRQPEIDGALVGGASLKAGEFVSIVEQSAQIKKPR